MKASFIRECILDYTQTNMISFNFIDITFRATIIGMKDILRNPS